jgi:hypothetical protein
MDQTGESLPHISFRIDIQGLYTFHGPREVPLDSIYKRESDSQPRVVLDISFQCESGEINPETGETVRGYEQAPFVVYADSELFTTWKQAFLNSLTAELPATLAEAAREKVQLIYLDIGDNMPVSVESKKNVASWIGERAKGQAQERLNVTAGPRKKLDAQARALLLTRYEELYSVYQRVSESYERNYMALNAFRHHWNLHASLTRCIGSAATRAQRLSASLESSLETLDCIPRRF